MKNLKMIAAIWLFNKLQWDNGYNKTMFVPREMVTRIRKFEPSSSGL